MNMNDAKDIAPPKEKTTTKFNTFNDLELKIMELKIKELTESAKLLRDSVSKLDKSIKIAIEAFKKVKIVFDIKE